MLASRQSLFRSARSAVTARGFSSASSASSSGGIPLEFKIGGTALVVAGGTVLFLSYRRELNVVSGCTKLQTSVS